MSYRVKLRAELLDFDCDTIVTDLNNATDSDSDGIPDEPQAFGFHFMREMSGTGEGSLNIPLTHPDVGTVVSGRYIRVWAVPDEDPNDEIVAFIFRIEGNPEYQQIDEGEEIAQFISVSGRGAGVMFEDPIVDREFSEDIESLDYSYRLFSFASFYFGDLPQFDDWGTSLGLYEYKDLTEAGTRGRIVGITDNLGTPDDTSDDVTNLYVAPVGFPWPNAYHNGDGADPTPVYSETYWMIDGDTSEDAVGYHFFRGYFTLADDQLTSFFVTGDNRFTLYLQGVPILGEQDDLFMWSGWKEVTLTLPAGLYVVAIALENVDVPSLSFNPGGALFNAIALSVYPGDTETSLTLNLLSSNTGWDSTFSADEFPGWTPAQIWLQLMIEFTARSGGLMGYAGPSFTDLLDTGGGAWDSVDPDTTIEFIPTFSVRLGASYLEVLDQLYNEGWVDWRFNFTTRELDMWAQGTVGSSTGISYAAPSDPADPSSGNIVGLVRGASKPYANALLVQYATGFVWVLDSGAITAYEQRVEDLLVTDAATRTEAERLGRVELTRRVVDSRSAILVNVEPQQAAGADCPLFALEEGDYADFPAIDGTPTEQQVLSITCDGDDENYAQWRLEVNNRWRSPPAELAGVLRQIGGKTMGSPQNRGGAALD